MLLDVQHISKSFTTGYIRKVKKDVLKDISFTLSKGETLGIAGTSGAGKTTLIRILMQLLAPDGGVVLYRGVDLGGLSGKEMLAARRTMQMIFQNPAALQPRMTIRESIEEPSRLYGKMDRFEERMQEMLSRLQLRRELLSRYPAELSGGELQRVALARLLLISPEVLILDEPTSMLDVSVQAEILTLLQELQEDREIPISSFLMTSMSLLRWHAAWASIGREAGGDRGGGRCAASPTAPIYAGARQVIFCFVKCVP